MNFWLSLVFATGLVCPSVEGQAPWNPAQGLGPQFIRLKIARCETGWTYFHKTNACYKTFFWKDFISAESLCRTVGAHLVSIHSAEENHFVAELAKTGLELDWTKQTWIGLRQDNYVNEGNWRWTDGTKVDYLAWSRARPDNERGYEYCAEIASDSTGKAEEYHKWNDIRCDTSMRSCLQENGYALKQPLCRIC